MVIYRLSDSDRLQVEDCLIDHLSALFAFMCREGEKGSENC
ncbi:hypothetical protein D931_03980 [Enterococcus faecium 13.SD.W.09]|nr:hypothetical protein D931_03980 [Enterococcus faecium 13.SD.W.09]